MLYKSAVDYHTPAVRTPLCLMLFSDEAEHVRVMGCANQANREGIVRFTSWNGLYGVDFYEIWQNFRFRVSSLSGIGFVLR
jgi:hypothetical protein